MLRTITWTPRILRSFATASNTTVDVQEIERFKTLNDEWWDKYGPLKTLHSMNLLRVPFMRDGLINTGIVDSYHINTPQPLEGLDILDVGCGGGILSEPISRLGAKVTGLDANSDIIDLAKRHAECSKLKINYVATSIEEHATENIEKYDAIVASEILEHVTQKKDFIRSCINCLKPSGSIFITTLNQTNLANFAGVFLAENILRLLPRGTHQFEKFIQPHELQRILEDNNCRTELIHGIFYNPLTNNWSWFSDTSINYAIHAVKLNSDE